MGSMFRRFLSMLLVVCMVVPYMMTGASAAETTDVQTTVPEAAASATVGAISATEPVIADPTEATASKEPEIPSDLTITGIFLEPHIMYEETGGEIEYKTDEAGTETSYYRYYWQNENIPWTVYFSDGTSETLRELIFDSFDFNGCWYHLETSDTQMEEPWKVGNTYPIELRLINETTGEVFSGESNVTILDGILRSITSYRINMFEGMDLENCEYEQDGEIKTWQRYNWEQYIQYTLTFTDGTSVKGTGPSFEYNGQRYRFNITDSQTPETPWTAGSVNAVTISAMGVKGSFKVAVNESPVKDVQLSRVSIPVNTEGHWEEKEVDGSVVRWWRYDWQNPMQYTVYFTDGTSVEGQANGFDYNGRHYEIILHDDQSAQNQWQPGGVYTVGVEVAGKTYNTEVELLESPIASVTVNDVSLYPYSQGYFREDEDGRYFWYNWSDLMTWTVTMTDGSTLYGSGSSFEYNGQWYYFETTETVEDQKSWKPGGTYQTGVNLSGLEMPVNVTIMESPIQSISVHPLTLIEGEGGYPVTDWSDKQQAYVKYTCYNWRDYLQYTVTFTDGTSNTYSGSGFDYNGKWIQVSGWDDQGPDSPWSIGNSYTVTVNVLGNETQLQVSIEASPIDRIELQPFNVYKGMRTDIRGESVYDDATDSWTWIEYEYYYWWETLPYTVYFTDGTSDSGIGGGFNYNGRWHSFGYIDEQSVQNPWQPGEVHTVTVEAMGKRADVRVTVNGSAVSSIVIDPISIPEGTGGSLYNAGTEDEYYFYEWQGYMNFTVYFADGTSYSGNGVYFEYQNQGYNLQWSSDQSAQNPWIAGNTYFGTVSALGYETQAQVTITESPLVSLSIAPITMVENTGGGMSTDWNPDTGYQDLEYYQYYWWDHMNYTAVFSDGTVLNGTGTSFYYQGRDYWFAYSNPQGYFSQWTADNTYTVDVSVMGKTVPVSISITESPLQSIVLTPATILENTYCGVWEDWVEDTQSYEKYNHYDWYNRVNATLTFTDGTVINTNVSSGFEYKGQQYSMSYTDDQRYVNRWLPGNSYTVEASLMGITAQTQVTIEKLPVQSVSFGTVSMKEYENGYWTTDWIDGTEYQYFYYWWNDRIPYTITFTDGSTVSGTGGGFDYNGYWIQFRYDNPQSGQNHFLSGNTYAVPVTVGSVTQDVYVTIYTSAQENGWEYMVQNGQAFITQCYNGSSTLIVPDTLGGYPVAGIISLSNVEWMASEVIIPDSVTMLNANLFDSWGWRNTLRKLTIGAGVTELNMNMFMACDLLEAVEVSPANKTYCSEDGVVFDMGKTTVVVFPRGKTGNYTIPTSVVNADAIMDNLSYLKATIDFNELEGYIKLDDVIFNEDKTVLYTCDADKTGSYVIPSTVTTINRFAFANSQLTEVTIPEGVTEIAYYAFNNSKLLEKVNIPESVTFIGKRAFEGCSNLVSADLPSNLQTLDMRAFADTALQNVVIPGSLKQIGWCAFYGANVANLTISEGVEYISGNAFAHTNVQSVVLPDSLIQMYDGVFCDCRHLTSLTIGSGLQTIPWNGFANTALTSVVFPENIEYIGGGAFANCSQLSQVTFMNDAIGFGDYAFENCPIESLELGQNVTYIGWSVFDGSALTEIKIPDSVTEVGYRAFANSTQLMDIDLSENLETLYWNAFDNTAWYNSQPDGPLFLENFYYGHKGRINSGAILNIPESVTRFAIGETGLSEYSAVVFSGNAPTGVEFGNPVTVVYPASNATWTDEVKSSMGSQITWLPALYSGTCGEYLSWVLTEDGTLHIFGFGRMFDFIYGGKLVRSAATVAPWYQYNDSITHIVIGEDVEYVGEYAFADCPADTIVFDGEAPQIGENAFYNVTATATYPTGFEGWETAASGSYGGTITWDALDTEVASGTCGDQLTWTLDESGTLTVSGTGDMYGYDWGGSPWYELRSDIKRVVVQEGVTCIGGNAFLQCEKLERVTLPDSLLTIGYSAFMECFKLEQAELPEGLQVIDSQAFSGGALTQVVIPDSVTYIGDWAFSVNMDLEQVTIGGGVGTMGRNVFGDCQSLKRVSVREGATNLGRNTFWNCFQLTEVELPDTVTDITYNMFRYCRSLTQLTLPDSVTKIAYNTFWESGLQEITIPQSVTEIGYAAFKYAWELREITFTGSAPSIDWTAFEGVNADVYYPGNDESWNGVAYNGYGGSLHWHSVVDYVAEGECGDNLTWHLTKDGFLEFKGDGLMYDYEAGTAPWYEYADQIEVLFLNNVSVVGAYAFYGCHALQSVNNFGDVVHYGDYSFYDCTSLSYVQECERLAVIGSYAFAGCSALGEFYFNANLRNIGGHAFEGCYNLQAAALEDNVNSVGEYAFADCTALQMVRLPAAMTQISDGLFSGCANLYNVYINGDITYIGNEAFMNCKRLSWIVLPESVSYIGDFAFFGCSALSELYIPKNVTNVGSFAMHNCTGLEEVRFSGNMPVFGYQPMSHVSATVYYPANAEGWTEEALSMLGGNVQTEAYVKSVAVVTDGENNRHYYGSLQEAVDNCDPESQYVYLQESQLAQLTLNADLYLDLNGFDLTGTITTNGYRIYGMDWTTDDYDYSWMGIFNCVDENGNEIIPEKLVYVTDPVREAPYRYMAIRNEAGWSFHRFYLGITHTSLKTDVVGLGYKATLCGDEMVAAQLDSYGYMLQLDGGNRIERWKGVENFVSGQTLTLRIKNWDVENHGETTLNAQIALKLVDGTVIESALYDTSMRRVLENVSAAIESYTAQQIKAVKELIERFAQATKDWLLEEIRNAEITLSPSEFNPNLQYARYKPTTFNGEEALNVTTVTPTGGIWSVVYVKTQHNNGQEGIIYNGETWYSYAGAGDDLSYSLTDTQVVFSINEGEFYIYCELLENGSLRVVSAGGYFTEGDILEPVSK